MDEVVQAKNPVNCKPVRRKGLLKAEYPYISRKNSQKVVRLQHDFVLFSP